MNGTNHLAGENSPYLKQHANDPVDWYPWGEAAFEKAKAENKPVFLSIGYSACHWCHVMERESFEDAGTAELLNRSFVSVKVDREERPDIDGVYMSACAAMTGSGGWPLSLFLTPEGKPFFAGTYFPKTACFGMPAFRDLLIAVESAWKKDRGSMEATAETITNRLNSIKKRTAAGEGLIEGAVKRLSGSFDREYGGFGRAPKFPSPHVLLFLLQQYEKHGDKNSLSMAETTLKKMYAGGLFDHIGGGFCRYSTDREFLVPHFEKMLYDNALLIIAYCRAYELAKDDLFLTAAERTAEYLLREMRSEDGGFFCSQDADSDGVEGRFYLFRPEEVVSVLGKKEGEAFNECFDVSPEGNFDGRSIPNLLKSGKLKADFEEQRKKLLEYRNKRASLLTDDKQLAFWNTLVITAFCVLYRVCGTREYLDAAMTAHAFIEDRLVMNNELYTGICGGKLLSRAFLDDHAGLALCRIALYGATLDNSFLSKAAESAEHAIEGFFDRESGGFFFSGSENERLVMRIRETYDGALPSGNSIMAYVLERLCALAPCESFETALEKQMEFMKAEASVQPEGCAMFLIALSDVEEPPVMVTAVCCGDEKADIPFNVPIGGNVRVLESETDEYRLKNGRPTYYVCRGKNCLAPSNKLEIGRSL